MDSDLFYASYIAVWGLALFQGFLALALLRRLEELRALMKQAWGEGAEEDFPLPGRERSGYYLRQALE